MTDHIDDSSGLHSVNACCRWCSKKVNIKVSMSAFNAHAVTHIQQNQTAKGKGKKAGLNPDEDKGEVIPPLEKTKTFDGQFLYLRYKTLQGEEMLDLEKLSDSLRPPPSPPRTTSYIQDNSNGCQLEVSKCPRISIQLNRLPRNVEDKIFRRKSILIPPTPGLPYSAIASETGQPAVIEEISTENNDDKMEEGTPTDPPELDPGSPQSISIVNIQDVTEEAEAADPEPLQKIRKRSLTPLRLFTQNWGHVNLLAQNLSQQDFNGFPENGSLVVGRDSSIDMWNQIETMKGKVKKKLMPTNSYSSTA